MSAVHKPEDSDCVRSLALDLAAAYLSNLLGVKLAWARKHYVREQSLGAYWLRLAATVLRDAPRRDSTT